MARRQTRSLAHTNTDRGEGQAREGGCLYHQIRGRTFKLSALPSATLCQTSCFNSALWHPLKDKHNLLIWKWDVQPLLERVWAQTVSRFSKLGSRYSYISVCSLLLRHRVATARRKTKQSKQNRRVRKILQRVGWDGSRTGCRSHVAPVALEAHLKKSKKCAYRESGMSFFTAPPD